MDEFLAKRREGATQPARRNSLFDQLLDGTQADQIAEIVKAVASIFVRGNEAQAFPVVQLFPCETENALDFFRAEPVRRTHQKINRLPFFQPFSAPRLAEPRVPVASYLQELASLKRRLRPEPVFLQGSFSRLPSSQSRAPCADGPPRSLPGP